MRFRGDEPNLETIAATLQRNFDPKYTPTEIIYENALLHATSYAEVSRILQTSKIVAPCYMILGGVEKNQGEVITRDFDRADHVQRLGDKGNWYVIQTNKDIFREPDERYYLAVKAMDKIGQEGVTQDGRIMVEQVLWSDGVL